MNFYCVFKQFLYEFLEVVAFSKIKKLIKNRVKPQSKYILMYIEIQRTVVLYGTAFHFPWRLDFII